jgi:hypothetical protein
MKPDSALMWGGDGGGGGWGLKEGRFELAWSGLTSFSLGQVGLGPVSDRSASPEDGDADLDFLGYYCIMHWEWLAAMSWLNWAWEFACEGVWVPRVGISLDGWIWQGTYNYRFS